jgi:hypothetical protein
MRICVGDCVTRLTTESNVQSKMMFVGSQRRRGFWRVDGSNDLRASSPFGVSFTGVGRSHAALIGSWASEALDPRAPGKGCWPAGSSPGFICTASLSGTSVPS